MPSFLLLLRRSKNFTSNVSILMHTLGPFPFFKWVLPNTSIYKLAFFLFFYALGISAASVCFEHSNFVNVNVPAPQDTQSMRLQMMV